MQFNPMDAFADPMKYWSDVIAAQMEIQQRLYDAATEINPLLPKVKFAAWFDMAPVKAAPSRPAAPAS